MESKIGKVLKLSPFAVAESKRPDDKAFTEDQIRRFRVCIMNSLLKLLQQPALLKGVVV